MEPDAARAQVPTGSITIIKDTNPETPDSDDLSFTFSGDLGDFSLEDGESRTFSSLDAASYLIRESLPFGWGLVAIDCNAEADVIASLTSAVVLILLQPDEHVTCTFVNKPAANIEAGDVCLIVGPNEVAPGETASFRAYLQDVVEAMVQVELIDIVGDSDITNAQGVELPGVDLVADAAVDSAVNVCGETNAEGLIQVGITCRSSGNFELVFVGEVGNAMRISVECASTPNIASLLADIHALALPAGIIQSLAASLNQAMHLLGDDNADNDGAVCGQLEALMKKVNASETIGQLTSTQAQELKDDIQAIEQALGCA